MIRAWPAAATGRTHSSNTDSLYWLACGSAGSQRRYSSSANRYVLRPVPPAPSRSLPASACRPFARGAFFSRSSLEPVPPPAAATIAVLVVAGPGPGRGWLVRARLAAGNGKARLTTGEGDVGDAAG